MRSLKGAGVKRMTRDEANAIMESIRRYRFLAGQLSNTCFNLAQRLRTPENGYESTSQLVRDFDAAELSLCMTLKEARLYKRLSDASATESERP